MRSGGSRSSVARTPKVGPTLTEAARRRGRGSARAGRQGPRRHRVCQGASRAREEARRRRAARAVLRRAEPGQAQGREIHRRRCSRCCAPPTTRTRTCVMRPRTRWPASARTPRSMRAVSRILPPPCGSASCSRTVNCAMRTSRGSSTTRMRTWRAKRPCAINDAPIEARIPGARGETRRRAGER